MDRSGVHYNFFPSRESLADLPSRSVAPPDDIMFVGEPLSLPAHFSSRPIFFLRALICRERAGGTNEPSKCAATDA